MQLGDFVKISTGGEEVRVAGDYQPSWRCLREFFDRRRKRCHARTCKTVGAVVGDEAKNGDVAKQLDLAQVFFGLGRLLRQTSRVAEMFSTDAACRVAMSRSLAD